MDVSRAGKNCLALKNIPHLLRGVTKLTAGHTGTQTVVADTDGVVFEGVCEIIVTLGHGSDEDADTLFGAERLHIVLDAHHGGVETKRHFPAVRGEMVGDWVFDDFQQFLLRVGGPDGEAVQELNHQTGKSLEGSRDADGRVDLDQDALGGVDVDLKLACLVDR